MRGWGYDLIKHDFSTHDVFARWGSEMGAELPDSNWSFADRRNTNADIVLELYRTLRDATGNAVLLGCNAIGHLGAGLFEIQHTGDDASGRVCERTRKMGVNTLAFRLPQTGTFFASCEPLDWLYTTTPRSWRIGGETLTYEWEKSSGANPLRA